MEFPMFTSVHLVKGEDLNHHGTLYAGRTAEWFVESGFIAAASMTKPENIVCLKIHGMTFNRPIRKGELPVFTSRTEFYPANRRGKNAVHISPRTEIEVTSIIITTPDTGVVIMLIFTLGHLSGF